jgi:hypothetical protein
LQIPVDLPPGTYRLAVSMYWYGDGKPLAVDSQPYAVLGEVNVQATP